MSYIKTLKILSIQLRGQQHRQDISSPTKTSWIFTPITIKNSSFKNSDLFLKIV